MTRLVPTVAVLVLGLLSRAAAEESHKDGVINLQAAIASTKDGQKAASELQARFGPKKVAFDKRQADIAGLQDQLNRGVNTLSDEARQNLVREIDQKTKSLNRDNEDTRSELDQEQQKLMNQLGGRMMTIVEKYAKDHGYTMILDVGSPQTPVLYRADWIDITKEVIDLYDKSTAPK